MGKVFPSADLALEHCVSLCDSFDVFVCNKRAGRVCGSASPQHVLVCRMYIRELCGM